MELFSKLARIVRQLGPISPTKPGTPIKRTWCGVCVSTQASHQRSCARECRRTKRCGRIGSWKSSSTVPRLQTKASRDAALRSTHQIMWTDGPHQQRRAAKREGDAELETARRRPFAVCGAESIPSAIASDRSRERFCRPQRSGSLGKRCAELRHGRAGASRCKRSSSIVMVKDFVCPCGRSDAPQVFGVGWDWQA